MTRWMAGVAGFAKALGLVTLCCGAAHAETTLKACNEAFKAYQAKRGTPAACVAACTGVTLGRGPAQLATCQQAVAAQAAVRPKPPRPAPAAAEDRPAPAPRRADRWRELGLVPVRIEGGSYRPGRPGATNDETPPSYDVRVAAFELSKTEVTVAQFRKCVNEGPCTAPQTGEYCKAEWFNWDKPDRANHPVNCVDWHQARKFAEWSGARLPTEAEWEWAARGRNEARKYPWGSTDPTCAVAVMKGEGGHGCGTNATWPTCQKPGGHSRDGVCDLGGNVWEWVEDAYEQSGHEGIPRDGTARTGAEGADRVDRGGGWWGGGPAVFRAAVRSGDSPGDRFVSLGFRVARPLP
jgi:formylglycine-generating enzyme required for sulfatase activity